MAARRTSSFTEVTMNCAKYSTRSRLRGEMSSSNPMRLGVPFTNQMWATGEASSM